MVPVVPPHIRRDVERPQASRVRTGISYKKKEDGQGTPKASNVSKNQLEGTKWKGSMILTALPSMSVVMDREAARPIEPFPTSVTDVLARLIAVTFLRLYWAGFFRRRRPAPRIRSWSPQVLYVMRGGDNGCRRPRERACVHSVENELGGDGPRVRSLIITAWSDEICKRG